MVVEEERQAYIINPGHRQSKSGEALAPPLLV
jgi:hypothetical protein